MNILYGVNATGNGHISRSRITISELKKRGHNVTVLFSGRHVKDFFDLEEFRPYIIKQGFTFVFKKGKLNVFKTLLNIDLIQFVRDVFKIKKEYDVVITDFEPISAYAARKLGIHCIGIGHQYSFLKKIPKSFKMKLASLFFLRFYTPINSTISSHFYHFNQSILPPFIEKGLKTKKFSAEVISYLIDLDYFRNIFQLKKFVEWIIVMLNNIENDEINLSDVISLGTNLVEKKNIFFDDSMNMSIKSAREDFEKKYLLFNLEKFKYNVTKMAKEIGMERTAIYRKLKLLNIKTELEK